MPKEGETFYYIMGDGIIADNVYYQIFTVNKNRLAMGNCFKTKEDAELALKKHMVYQELKQFADENNGPIDWNDERSHKYSIACSHEEIKRLYITCWATYQFMGCVWFSSMELAEQAIQKVGEDRIKKYLFGVK